MNIKSSVFAVAAIALSIGCATPAWSDFELNMPVGVTTSSREIYDLHMLILFWCTGIAVAVYAAMVYAIVKFRISAWTRSN
jgi:cytochrome c oxidase subunit 2